jgi:hypothetical protein
MHPAVMDMVVRSITDERLRAAEQYRRAARAAVYTPRQGLLRRLAGRLASWRRSGRSQDVSTVPGGAQPCLPAADGPA